MSRANNVQKVSTRYNAMPHVNISQITGKIMVQWICQYEFLRFNLYLSMVYTYTPTKICSRCRVENTITYSCEHTNEKQMCKECYQYIHWLLNSNIPENQKES
jgi:hypothetical protein